MLIAAGSNIGSGCSVYDDGGYPTGNLCVRQRGDLSVIGRAFRDFLSGECDPRYLRA